MQERELGVGEDQRLAGEGHLVATGVDHQFAHRHGGLVLRLQFGLLASQDGLDPGGEYPRAERLGDVVVGPPLEPCHHVALLALGGEHDDRDVAGLGVALEPTADLEPVDHRQHQVEHDQVGRLAANHFERLVAGGHAADAVALLGEVVADEFEKILLVVHHKHMVAGGVIE